MKITLDLKHTVPHYRLSGDRATREKKIASRFSDSYAKGCIDRRKDAGGCGVRGVCRGDGRIECRVQRTYEESGNDIGVFYSLAGSCSLEWCHGMRCVAEKRYLG